MNAPIRHATPTPRMSRGRRRIDVAVGTGAADSLDAPYLRRWLAHQAARHRDLLPASSHCGHNFDHCPSLKGQAVTQPRQLAPERAAPDACASSRGTVDQIGRQMIRQQAP